MVNLKRNNRQFYYCLRKTDEPLIDEWGNETGENPPIYDEPVPYEAHVSGVEGNPYKDMVTTQEYGLRVDYNKVIITHDMDCPIKEDSVLFLDKEPEFDDDGNPLYDYIIVKVDPTINIISITAKRVETT